MIFLSFLFILLLVFGIMAFATKPSQVAADWRTGDWLVFGAVLLETWLRGSGRRSSSK